MTGKACVRELHIDQGRMARAVRSLYRAGRISMRDASDLMAAVGFWNENAGKVFCNHKVGEVVK
jgi:hypothetical protein